MGLSMGPWVGRVDVASGRSCRLFFASSIEILDGRSFRFLLPIDAFSRGKEPIKRKGAYSPRHVTPTEDLLRLGRLR